ncbi:MAG: hypothetical protein M3680_16600, partial [Myxococcota bacterium]|nr:hypothetical protein [Myxococcota bacterium]
SDLSGAVVALSAPLPSGAFLAGPGLGGAIELADQLAGMQVGARRTATSLELAYFPRAAIETAVLAIERKPDAGGHRVFALSIRFGTLTIASELVLDAAGLPVRQAFGAPLDVTFERVR